jgi:hypothetical protein
VSIIGAAVYLLVVYVFIPAYFIDAIGLWMFLLYPVWIVGAWYFIIEDDSEDDDSGSPSRGDALSWGFMVLVPSVISAIVFLLKQVIN